MYRNKVIIIVVLLILPLVSAIENAQIFFPDSGAAATGNGINLTTEFSPFFKVLVPPTEDVDGGGKEKDTIPDIVPSINVTNATLLLEQTFFGPGGTFEGLSPIMKTLLYMGVLILVCICIAVFYFFIIADDDDEEEKEKKN